MITEAERKKGYRVGHNKNFGANSKWAAKALLTRINPPIEVNENIDMLKVARFMVAMADGKWDQRENDPIMLSNIGIVFDGLHRLTAISLLNIDVPIFIKQQ